jgi:hypothetical protein
MNVLLYGGMMLSFLKIFLREGVPEKEPPPGAVIAIQAFGDFLGFNPHCHILAIDGCFYGSRGMFRLVPPEARIACLTSDAPK